ncbi:hypothetical protein A0H81_10546 [Grifola frondosa]|uniref:Uncharacterized protein n=1 Tax=Grifola frondosa TaxID=5627 RepID=A0A1C7LYM9_GRIFR|nr:hypothetical protein A0H81_10546 [Grifola frondosa]
MPGTVSGLRPVTYPSTCSSGCVTTIAVVPNCFKSYHRDACQISDQSSSIVGHHNFLFVIWPVSLGLYALRHWTSAVSTIVATRQNYGILAKR